MRRYEDGRGQSNVMEEGLHLSSLVLKVEKEGHKPRKRGRFQKLEKRGNGFYPEPRERNAVLPTPWF